MISGELLRSARHAFGFGSTTLAEREGVSDTAILRFEKGEATLSAYRVRNLIVEMLVAYGYNRPALAMMTTDKLEGTLREAVHSRLLEKASGLLVESASL